MASAGAPVPAPAAAAADPDGKGIFGKIKVYLSQMIDKALLTAAPEVGHLSPVIAIFGTLFFAIITMNPSLGFLGFGAIEATLLHGVLKTTGTYFASPTSTAGASASSPDVVSKCTSSFQSMTPSRFKLLLSDGLRPTWPNSALYYLSFFAAYCIQSMLLYNKETTALGPSYSNRPYLAMIAGSMLITLYLVYLLVYGCDSFFSLVFSIGIGLFIGVAICLQNSFLFGRENANVLFIPPILRKDKLDYVCVATPK